MMLCHLSSRLLNGYHLSDEAHRLHGGLMAQVITLVMVLIQQFHSYTHTTLLQKQTPVVTRLSHHAEQCVPRSLPVNSTFGLIPGYPACHVRTG